MRKYIVTVSMVLGAALISFGTFIVNREVMYPREICFSETQCEQYTAHGRRFGFPLSYLEVVNGWESPYGNTSFQFQRFIANTTIWLFVLVIMRRGIVCLSRRE